MHPTQLEILNSLRQDNARKFSELLRDVAETSDNLSYHLKQLQKINFIDSPEKGAYTLAQKRAEYVILLITNPFNDEAFDSAASWRNDPANNPFTFEERAFMFKAFFEAIGIEPSRYDIKPFNIKNPIAFATLDPAVPNLVNVYSEWSAKKLVEFIKHGLQVVRLDQPKSIPISGTKIREIIKTYSNDREGLGSELIEAGFMPHAFPGLLEVLYNKRA